MYQIVWKFETKTVLCDHSLTYNAVTVIGTKPLQVLIHDNERQNCDC